MLKENHIQLWNVWKMWIWRLMTNVEKEETSNGLIEISKTKNPEFQWWGFEVCTLHTLQWWEPFGLILKVWWWMCLLFWFHLCMLSCSIIFLLLWLLSIFSYQIQCTNTHQTLKQNHVILKQQPSRQQMIYLESIFASGVQVPK